MGATYTLGDIAGRIGGTVEGDAGLRIEGVRPLEDAGPSHLGFLVHGRYARQAAGSLAGAILVSPDERLSGRNLVRVADPYLALARVMTLFHPARHLRPGVDPEARIGRGTEIHAEAAVLAGARVGENCRVGARTCIHAGVVIGEECRIGADAILYPNVTLYARTLLGDRVVVHAGAVIGSDGFGFAREGEEYRKIPQVGWVEVGDDVEIGANSTIDRGTFGPTRIGRGTKIDNLVQVAHNVQVGENCVLVAQSGVAGSTRLGPGVMLAGQSGVAGHLEVGGAVRVGAKSAVLDDVPAGSFVVGHPAIDHRQWKRMQAALRRLPEMLRRLRGSPAAARRRRREG